MLTLEQQKCNRFSLFGISIELRGPSSDRWAEDFDYFQHRPVNQENAAFFVSLEQIHAAPEADSLPSQAAAQVFPECVLYHRDQQLVYDYHGEAHLTVEQSENSTHGILRTTDPALAHELGYLFLQSEIGRFLEAQALHRVHALGFGLPSGKGVLVLLPSGGGKSTLTTALLEHEGITLLSDDTPLVDRFGNLRPYPLRLSFRSKSQIPESWLKGVSHFERRKHGAKWLVSTAALPAGRLPRIDEKFRPGYLVLGIRHGALNVPHVKRVSRWKGALPLFRDLVVGLGIPQVAELVLTKGISSLPGLAPAALSRTAAAAAFASRAKVIRLELSRHPELNAEALLKEIQRMEEARP